jgi:hypothetical protein
MAIIWDQPQKIAAEPLLDEVIKETIEEAEQDEAAAEILQEIETEQFKSPFRGFGS